MEHGDMLARSTRLAQIQHLLHTPGGLTSLELARLCGVCPRTIQRDLLTLQSDLQIPVTKTGDRYGLISGYILPPVSFSLYEAMTLFLASRLAIRQTDENNPHISTALSKMASVLPHPLEQQLKEIVKAIKLKPGNDRYVRIFELVAIAWSTQRRMRILYRSLQSTEVKEWRLDPYFVDMTGLGFSIYVIGYAFREGKEGIITFKMERIEEADILEEGFEIPEGLNLEKLMESAWGVIWGEEIEVKLKFSALVARRVKESVWHHSQKVEDLADESCLMTLKVGSTLEITPWIRSWGPDVEVIEPQELRDEFRRWATRQYELYH